MFLCWRRDVVHISGHVGTLCSVTDSARPFSRIFSKIVPQRKKRFRYFFTYSVKRPREKKMVGNHFGRNCKRSALLVRIPKQSPSLYLGFILVMGSVKLCFANTFSPNGQIIVMVSCHAVFRMAVSRHDLYDITTRCIMHVPPTTAEIVIRHRVVLVCCFQCYN